MVNKLYFIIVFLLFEIHGVKSQLRNVSDGNGLNKTLLFNSYKKHPGIPDLRTRLVFQDSWGILWIGTMNGLCRFDGYDFIKYHKTASSNSISANSVLALTEDQHQDLWIGTNLGLTKFNREKEEFTNFNLKNKGLPIFTKRVNALLSDKNNRLWIGSSNGLACYDINHNKLSHFKNYPFNGYITAIASPGDGWLWIATNDGLIHYCLANGKFEFLPLNIHANPYGEKIWSVIQIHDNLFVGTGGNGLLKISLKKQDNYKKAIINFGPSPYITNTTQIFDIRQSSTGELWLATESGLAELSDLKNSSPTLKIYRHNPLSDKSISSNIVYSLCIDKDNNLWCGSESGLDKTNLNLLPVTYYTFSHDQQRDRVRSLISKDGNAIFFGTSTTGVFKFDVTADRLTQLNTGNTPSNSNNRSICQVGGSIWAGGLNGISVFKTSKSDKDIEHKNLGATFAILEDRRNNKWIGTLQGLICQRSDGQIINYSDSTMANPGLKGFIRTLFEDHSGRIWIGFENTGLGFIAPNTGKFEAVQADKSGHLINGQTFFSIAESPYNTFWAGSENGLNRISLSKDNEITQIKSYSDENGLPDKSINGILADNSNRLWIGTLKGLMTFDIKNETVQPILRDIDFSTVANFKVNNHCFLWGTDEGFISFDPNKIKKHLRPPDTYITDFKLFNIPVKADSTYHGQIILSKPIAYTKKISLNWQNNVFTISFSGIHFSDPQNNKYQYKLEGFDQNWVSVTALDRNATYTNLNFGNYIFKVRTANSNGVWGRTPAVLMVTVLPPPWKTWWAIAFYLIVFTVILYVFISYATAQSRYRQQLHYEKLEKQQITNLNQTKVKFFTEISHEFRTPLTLIVGPVNDLLVNHNFSIVTKEKLNMVARNCKKLLYLIDELMVFQKAEQGMLFLKKTPTDIVQLTEEIYKNFNPLAIHKKINFTFNSDIDSLFLNIEAEKIEMAINNLIINAVKFTPENGAITVKIAWSEFLNSKSYLNPEKWVRISIEDNGKGIDEKDLPHLFDRFFSDSDYKGSGIGLSLSKSLIELHEGEILFSSNPNVKTIFNIYLPVKDGEGESDHGETTKRYAPEFVSDCVAEELNSDAENSVINHHSESGFLLIVDDNLEVLNFLEMLFKNNFNIKKASNGKMALAIIEEAEPIMVISDVMMPEMDGIELCRTLKTSVITSHIPVILLTAKTATDHQMEGLVTGADDYVAKPFQPDVLAIKVFNQIETRKKLITRYQDSKTFAPEKLAKNPLDEEFLLKVKAAIDKNLGNENFGVEELSNIVCMSRSHLFRKIKAITGQNPIELINSIRLNYAANLLLARRLNISQISYEVGFKNPPSFTTAFKKHFSKSPSDFLKNAPPTQA